MTMELRKGYINGVYAGSHSKNKQISIRIRHDLYWCGRAQATGLGFYVVTARELK